MVSFQAPYLHLIQRNTILDSDNTNSKKRKWDHDHTNDAHHEEILPYKHWKTPKPAPTSAANTAKAFSDVELHLETPLPSEWQRCLDIQSGAIHFYNIRTQKRTLRDPREESTKEQPSSPRDCHMSLDLELNLPCGSLNHNSSFKSSQEETNLIMKKSGRSSPPASSTDFFKCLSSRVENKSPSDGAKDDQAVVAEMVAAACMRCHMLVMLQKSSPTCPNCKYVYPPYQTPPDLFKPKLSLSC